MDEMNSTYNKEIRKAATAANLPLEKLQGKNILVTGATGLIGSCVVELLLNCDVPDCHVYASGRNEDKANELFKAYSNNRRLHFVQHDVTEELKTDTIFHYIIHAASGANPVQYSTNPVGIMKANIWGTDNLLRYGLEHHMEKFVYVSSGDAYGECEHERITEDCSGYVNPQVLRSCYPSSKRAAESLCTSYLHQYGLDICVARPCHTFGPCFSESDSRAYAQFIRNIIAGEDIILKSKGEQYRSWCYVVDCASAILYIALKGKSGEAYNIADDNARATIAEFAGIIAEIGKKKICFQLPDKIESNGYNTISRSIFDTTKLKSLGWNTSGNLLQKLEATIHERIQRFGNLPKINL